MDLTNIEKYLDLCDPILKVTAANLIILYVIFAISFKFNNLVKKNTQKSIVMWIELFLKSFIETLSLPHHIPRWEMPKKLSKGINYFFAMMWFFASFILGTFSFVCMLLLPFATSKISFTNFLIVLGISFTFFLGSRFFYVEGRKTLALNKDPQITNEDR